MKTYDQYVRKCSTIPIAFPPQHQDIQPGIQKYMVPQPVSENPNYHGSGKLEGKIAIITGGDSGIGRAVAILFAKEGADIAIAYLPYERVDAVETRRRVEQLGKRCIFIEGDVRSESFCIEIVQRTMETYGRIDIVVNNAGVAYLQPSVECISAEQLDTTFRTNVFSCFYLVKAALPYLKRGASIINNISVTAYEGFKGSIDYSASKGALVLYTRSLAQSLLGRGIRVNGVAPGMAWTPLIVSAYPAERVALFGTDRPMGRAAEPYEIAPSFLFLASEMDSSYITGQVIIVT